MAHRLDPSVGRIDELGLGRDPHVRVGERRERRERRDNKEAEES